jgi:hypothetical protein
MPPEGSFRYKIRMRCKLFYSRNALVKSRDAFDGSGPYCTWYAAQSAMPHRSTDCPSQEFVPIKFTSPHYASFDNARTAFGPLSATAAAAAAMFLGSLR